MLREIQAKIVEKYLEVKEKKDNILNKGIEDGNL
jgi:hypothetical protein